MKNKIIGMYACMLLLGILLQMTSVISISSATSNGAYSVNPIALGGSSKTIFIGKHTLLSQLFNPLRSNVVGWMIVDGHIHRYRGPLPLDSENFFGFIGKTYLIIVFETNPFK